jgi:hypothetical protein
MWLNLDDKQMTGVEAALASTISRYREALDTLNGNQALNASEIQTVTAAKDELQAILDRFGKIRSDFDPADPYRAAAQEQADDDLEIDQDAVVSSGDDAGAWVMGWTWVTDEAAGLFTCEECSGVFTLDRRAGDCLCDECAPDDENTCRDCGEEYADGGDGYNGRCPDCADKAEAEGRSDD